jgi:PAS domain S-box-containing protein
LDLLLQDAKTLKRTIADTAAAINFRAIMEGTDDYVYFKDRNHVFTGASQTLVSLCPNAKHWSDLIGQTDYDVFPEELADCYYRLERQIFDGLPIASEIQPTVDKAGRKGWVDNRKYPLRDDDGTIIGLYGIARDITELKQAAVVHESDAALAERSRRALLSAMEDQQRVHTAVREREARYAVMVNSISDAIVSADSAGQIIAWNPGAERIFGYSAREILGQSLRLLIPPRHLEHHETGMARVLAGGPHHIIGTTMEAEGRREDGSEFPLNLSLSEWQIGPQKFFTAVIRDISEQNVHKREIERLNRFYELISLVRQVLMRRKDRDQMFAEVCRVVRDCGRFQITWIGWLDPTTGLLDPVAVSGDDQGYVPRLRISANPDLPEGQGPSGLAFREGRVVVCNDFFADPTTRPWREAAARSGFQSSIALPLRQDGRPAGLLTVYAADKNVFGPKEIALLEQAATDLSFALDILAGEARRDQAEARLRKLSTIIEQAPLSVVITDLAGTIEYVNPRFTRVTGYAPEEVLGHNPRVLKSGETTPDIYRAMWSALTRGEVWTGELRNRSKNGELILESAVIAPVVDDHGRATHYVALKDDITAQRRATAETAAQLEKEHQISEMKTRFISLTSHEFRTPMAAALGSVEILANHLDRLDPAKRTELLARIASSLHRMDEMLDEMLLLNRIDANRVEVKPSPVDLRSFLASEIEEIRLGDRDGHRFAFHPSGDGAPFVTDPGLLHHMISNLLSNAVRYSRGDTLVTVHLDVTAGHLRVTIEDEGIGIPEKDRPRLFEAFERGSNVGTIKGTGLGLNIVKRMTELLGGTITLEPSTGVGSRFTLQLPPLPAPTPSR